MPSEIIAIDVAILVDGDVAATARALNLALAAGRADALRLDTSHLPHVTLAQQFVDRARLDDLFTEIDRIVRHEPALVLRISRAVVDHGTAQLVVDASPDLHRLHELVMDAIEPFESPEGGADAFRADGEKIRPEDVDWVRSYRDDAAYAHYRPHVTVGHAAATLPVDSIDFRAGRVGVCHLGRYCTCRTVLREWTLT